MVVRSKTTSAKMKLRWRPATHTSSLLTRPQESVAEGKKINIGGTTARASYALLKGRSGQWALYINGRSLLGVRFDKLQHGEVAAQALEDNRSARCE